MAIIRTITTTAEELQEMLDKSVDRAIAKVISTMNHQQDEILSVNRACRVVCKRPELLLKAINTGELIAKRDGKRWAIRRADLSDWAKRAGLVA